MAAEPTVYEFVDWVRQGLYKKISVALYRDLDGRGPYLRHVGFLGAQPPQVKGMAPAHFADADGFETLDAARADVVLDLYYDVAPPDTPWDGKAANYADAASYARACAFVRGMTDPHKGKIPDGLTKGDCYLPHHDADMTLVPRGVSAAMAAVNGGRGGPNLTREGKQKAYDHLATHYKNDLKAEAPEAKFEEKPLTPLEGGNGPMEKELEKMKADLAAKEGALAKASADLAEFQKLVPPGLAGGGQTASSTGSSAAADVAKVAKNLADFKEKAENAEKALAAARVEARRKETQAFLEKGIADGKVLPAWREMGLIAFIESLPDGEKDATLEFAEAGKGKASVTPRKWLEKFLETLPEIVNFRAEATKQRAARAQHGAGDAADEFEEEGAKIAATLGPGRAGGSAVQQGGRA